MPDFEEFVRPSRRCLDDLNLSVPHLGVLLHELEHPLIMKAQQTPERASAAANERIRSLTDRAWFKVKTSGWRGAAGQLDRVLPDIRQTWWLAAAGPRAADSPQHDFYSQISDEAHATGPNTCSTDFLLPTLWDRDRLQAEAAVKAERVIRELVQRAAGESLLNGDIRGFDIGDRNVRVRVKILRDGQAYVAIGSTGSVDVAFMTTLFASMPGLSASDWMPEPSEVLGFEPAQGEILWSAMISPETQEELLSAATRDW